MHGSASLQAVLSGALETAQPLAGLHASTVQGLPSSHVTLTPEHSPPPHLSLPVQRLPSSQASVFCVLRQPLAGSHASVVQRLLSSQSTAEPTHRPARHSSCAVHAEPSLQPTPSAVKDGTHRPVAAWQTVFRHVVSPVVLQVTTVA
ncbi:MAG: hypothetical protein IT385_02415 [Deltaproteobacteria bacterium]|nr:hypothetical protein [Deltaproteobacteria bacterium]